MRTLAVDGLPPLPRARPTRDLVPATAPAFLEYFVMSVTREPVGMFESK